MQSIVCTACARHGRHYNIEGEVRVHPKPIMARMLPCYTAQNLRMAAEIVFATVYDKACDSHDFFSIQTNDSCKLSIKESISNVCDQELTVRSCVFLSTRDESISYLLCSHASAEYGHESDFHESKFVGFPSYEIWKNPFWQNHDKQFSFYFHIPHLIRSGMLWDCALPFLFLPLDFSFDCSAPSACNVKHRKTITLQISNRQLTSLTTQ